MRVTRHFVSLLSLVLVAPVFTSASPMESAACDEWVARRFMGNADALPLSFTFDGKPSAGLLPGWTLERSERKLDQNRTELTLSCTDSKTGLRVRCVAVRYHDFPAVEWTPYFKNTGTSPTAIISDVQALDTTFERAGPGDFLLDHAKGSPAEQSSYEPYSTPLGSKQRKLRLATFGGRSSNSTMPYWKVTWGDAGAVFAVGWPGQWAASFDSVGERSLRIRAGQELTHFKLNPGEEVRAPLIAMVFWQGDRFRGHNLWRTWMLAHNVPRVNGAPPPTQLVAQSSHQFNEMQDATEANQKLMIDRYLAERLPLRYWWMDAGWYVNNGTWKNTGTWEVDRKRFPKGLRAVTDYARAKGVQSIVWFEPERVTAESWIFRNHPEWCIEQDKIPAEFKNPPKDATRPHGYHGKGNLFNFGHPEAWQWMVNHIDKLITSEGIDLYRQDFNLDPLPFWRGQDAPDRQGITEIRYVTGLLAYWDELVHRHPGMLIDACASGGRRNDLETMRRGLPLLRDDYLFEPIGQQGHTYGISFWIPYHGTGTRFVSTFVDPLEASAKRATDPVDVYLFRSHMAPTLNACWDVRRDDLDYDALRRLMQQFEKVSRCYLGDYYPLTSYNLSNSVWMAWQFDRPDLGEGLVQVFRRDGSPYESARFVLHGLNAAARYEVTNLDGGSQIQTGGKLMTDGMVITAPTPRAALIYSYKLVR